LPKLPACVQRNGLVCAGGGLCGSHAAEP
jgi:hypothetical protein